MHSDIGGVCASRTAVHKPASSPWGTSLDLKYSLGSLVPNFSALGALLQGCVGVLLRATRIWTGTRHPLLDVYKIRMC